MIRESCQNQMSSGKIPTCIMPFVDRIDDVDINEYFNLRIARYYRWTHDKTFLIEVWGNLVRSIEYLLSTDSDNDKVVIRLFLGRLERCFRR